MLDMGAGAWFEPKRNYGAVAGALCFYIGKTTAAKSVRARHVRRRNSDIEAIAATISFIVVQRLV